MLPDNLTPAPAGHRPPGILQRSAVAAQGGQPGAGAAVPEGDRQQQQPQQQSGRAGFYERMAKMGVNVPESLRSRYQPPAEEM